MPNMGSIGVERARGRLGELVDEVARKGGPIVLTKRGEQRAVLLSQAEFERLKTAASRNAREELRARLAIVREQVTRAKIDPRVVDQAIAAARRGR